MPTSSVDDGGSGALAAVADPKIGLEVMIPPLPFETLVGFNIEQLGNETLLFLAADEARRLHM